MPWTWGVRGFLNLKGWKLIEKPDQEIIRLQYCLLMAWLFWKGFMMIMKHLKLVLITKNIKFLLMQDTVEQIDFNKISLNKSKFNI